MKTREHFALISTMSCLATLTGCSEPSATSTWIAAGELAQARSNHAATPLSNGSILVTGGTHGSKMLASAEVRNAVTNHWSLTESMHEPRMQHASARIRDDRILIVGGTNGNVLSSIEAFDPAANAFSMLAPMNEARIQPAMQWVKSSAQLLVVGGLGSNGPLSSVEAYDPQTNAWSEKKNMPGARAGHTATLIEVPRETDAGPEDDFWLVVLGGKNEIQETTNALAIYGLTNDQWTVVDDPLVEARRDHTATQLRDGSILVIGGKNDVQPALSSAERFRCGRDELTTLPTCTSESVGSLLHARHGHTATRMSDGNVLVVGGEDANGVLDSVEMFDVVRNEFVEMKPLASARTQHTATWLADGSVLVVGGNAATELATTERFVPDDPGIPCQTTQDCPEAAICNAELRCEQTPWPLSSESACTYAAHRAPANHAIVGASLALLLGAWRRRRKRVAKWAGATLVLGGIVVFPRWAEAQVSTFYLDRLQIAGGSEDGTAVWRPVFGRTGVFGQLAFGYARDPLRVSSFVHDPTRAQALFGSAVNLQITGYATAGMEIAERGAIQVSLPYVVHQRGYATDNRAVGLDQPVDLATSTLGDVRIDGRMLMGGSESGSFRLAFRGALFLPTGDEFSFTGERNAWGNAGLSAEYDAKALFVTANAGWTVRPKSTLVDLTVASEFVYALGAYVPLMHERLRVGAELFGGIGLSSLTPQTIPLEAALTTRLALGAERRVFLGLSAGGRMGFGIASDLRFVARIGGVLPFADVPPEPSLPLRLVPFTETNEKPFVAVFEKKGEAPRVANLDADRDGVDTPMDACPEVPEDKDGLDDDDGCPEDDADGDEIADSEDKCPKDPGIRGQDPKKVGCPQFIERTKTEVVLHKQIEFEFNSATIARESYPILDEIGKLLQADKAIKQLRIEGYTDNVGSDSFNRSLSQRRAEAVRNYLVERGKVHPSRLSFAGFGPEKPIAPNNTDAGRAKNRRVELHIGGAEGGKKP